MWRSTADSHPAYCPPRPPGLILQNSFLGCELSVCILLPGSISGTTDAVQVVIDTLLSYLTLLYVWPKGYHLATHVLGFQFSGSPDPCQNWTSFLRGPWEEVRMPGRIVLLATSVHYHHLITCQCSGDCPRSRSVRFSPDNWVTVGNISIGTGFVRTVHESAFVLCNSLPLTISQTKT